MLLRDARAAVLPLLAGLSLLGCVQTTPIGMSATVNDSATTTEASLGNSSTTSLTSTTDVNTEAGTETGGQLCDLNECLNRVKGDCVPGDCPLVCDDPWDCPGEELCPAVRIQPLTFDDPDYHIKGLIEDAICVLEKLRDRQPGKLQLDFGDLQGFSQDAALKYYVTIDILGGGDVLVWWFALQGGGNFDERGKSRTMELAPVGYFDDCLIDPTEEALIKCLIDIVDVDIDKPLPPDYMPPWLTGECRDTEPSCT